MVAIILAVLGLAGFVGVLYWLNKNHIEESPSQPVEEISVEPEHIPLVSVVRSNPAITSPFVEDIGPDLVDVAVATAILSADIEPVGDNPPPDDIGPYPEPMSTAEIVWDYPDAVKLDIEPEESSAQDTDDAPDSSDCDSGSSSSDDD